MSNKVVYKITADGKGYVRTLQRMRGDTKKFGSDVKGEMSGIGSAIKGAFAYVGFASFKSVIDEVAQLGRLARNLGADFEGFQTVTNAARQFGIEAETVADAIKDLDVKMTDGSLGAKAYAEVFDLVGISLDEAMGMNSLERFYAFADAVKAADGQLSAFSADEINDAMFRLLPLLEQGSAGIKTLGNEYAKFSKEQQKMAEEGAKAWDNLVHNLKWLIATLAGTVIPFMQNFAHTIGAVVGEGAAQFGLFGKGLKKFFTGDFAGANAAFGALADYASNSFERVSGEIKDIWKETTDEIENGTPTSTGGVSTQTQEEIDNQKAELEKEVNKQLEEQEKRRLELMSDEEKLLDIQKKKLAIEKELAELGERLHEEGATPEETLKLAEKTTKWEELQTEEQKKKLEIEKKIQDLNRAKIKAQDKQNQKEIDEQIERWRAEGEKEKEEKEKADKFKDEASDLQEQIDAERKEREELGMSGKEILARRKAELAEKEKAFSELGADANKDGKVDAEDDVFRNEAQLDIEQRKTEIKNIEAGLKSDPQTSIIASSLASIGGGGGVASFGNDPLLNENKRQTSVLEQIASNTSKGEDGTPPQPEL